MKGTEKIIAHIRSDAKEQADAILAQAEQQCASIRTEYDAKAKELYREKIRAGTNDCQDRVDSMDRIARMEAKKGELAVKQQMVAAAFDKAFELLTSMPEAEYIEFLARLAAKAAVTGSEELVLNARDKAAIGKVVVNAANERLENGALTLSEAVGDFAGGLILRRGSVEANCTVELLVELARGELSSDIAKKLFG